VEIGKEFDCKSEKSAADLSRDLSPKDPEAFNEFLRVVKTQEANNGGNHSVAADMELTGSPIKYNPNWTLDPPPMAGQFQQNRGSHIIGGSKSWRPGEA
jgi:hypothetical protein